MFDAGETNILEYNKAQLNLLSVKKKMKELSLEKDALLTELKGLNGGTTIEFNDSTYSPVVLPEYFEQWYLTIEEINPVLKQINQDLEISKKEEQLSKSLSLPKFNAGYMSETLADEQFQGITIGLSIPVWENKNQLKYSKAKVNANESIQKDVKINQYYNLKSLYERTLGLKTITDEYRESISNYKHTELLKKSLDAGEISLIDYILELTFYYDSFNMLLESERDLHKLVSELYKYQL